MLKELKVGTTYYFKIKVSYSISGAPDRVDYIKFDDLGAKYRINGNTWLSPSINLGFGYDGTAEQYKMLIDGIWTSRSAGDVIEIYGQIDYITSDMFSFLENLLLKSAIENPYQIQLYKNGSDDKVVSKTLTLVDTLYGAMREETNVLTPSIMIEMGSRPLNFNYVYIPNFGRFYYLMNTQLVRNNIYRIDLKVDVLMSFADDIREQEAFISRNENIISGELIDTRLPVTDIPTITFLSAKTGNLPNITWDYDSNVVGKNIAFHVINDININFNQDADKPTGTTLPTIKRRTGDNILLTAYALDISEWGYVCDAIKTTSSLAGYVGGAIYFPFDLKSDCAVDSGGHYSTTFLKINTTQIKDDSSVDVESYNLKGESSKYWVFCDFTLTERYVGDARHFLNYEPYSIYELYVPFHRWVKIPATPETIGSRIIGYYAVDYVTGDGSVFIYNYTQNKMIYCAPVQIGIKLGVSTTNIEELTKQKQTNATNLMLGLIGSATSIGIGIGTGNPLGIVGGVLSGTKAIANAVNINRMMIERANCEISGDKIGLYGGYVPILKFMSYEPLSSFNSSLFGKLQGHPANVYRYLNGVSGYTEIPEMHYTPVDYNYITKTEIDEIISLARDGIIL